MLHHQRPPEKKEKSGIFSKILKTVEGIGIKIEYTGKKEEDKVVIDDLYDKTSEKMHMFVDQDPIQGDVVLTPRSNYQHLGIKVMLLGVVTTLTDRENKTEFSREEKVIEPGVVSAITPIPFLFKGRRDYESYRGINAKVQYFIRVSIQKKVKNVSEQEEVWVSKVDGTITNTQTDASIERNYFREKTWGSESVRMEVGVENVLHIEFRWSKKIFHLEERVVGQVTFKIMDLDLQYGEVSVVRKETIGTGKPTDPVESETLQKFEIMDGTPCTGEVVPIRLYLNSIPRLTPTYPNVHNLFRVLYYFNLVLITGEGKRYFKQYEITFYRCPGQETPSSLHPRIRKSADQRRKEWDGYKKQNPSPARQQQEQAPAPAAAAAAPSSAVDDL